MAKVNVPAPSIKTHEGGTAKRINPELQLRRSVMACLLWEDSFYESGEDIASRIMQTIPKVAPATVAAIAIEAREQMKLRHVPLLIVREMARHKEHKALVADTLSRVIQRADELSEFLAIYWKEKKQPLSAQVKKGLAAAFTKFSAYDLAKYNRDGTVKLRDVLFLCHAKPKDETQAAMWKRLIAGTLESPDTWEVELSAGKDKKETWTRLMAEKKLGALAFLRNLRNMQGVDVDRKAMKDYFTTMKVDRVLPYRFIAAARFAPDLEPELETSMFKAIEGADKIKGRTVLLIDVSGSMDSPISNKSDLKRFDAACGLAILARELCEDVRVFTFSEWLCEVPPRRGFALRDAIVQSQPHGGTWVGAAVNILHKGNAEGITGNSPNQMGFQRNHPLFCRVSNPKTDYHGGPVSYDRLIVITDEQAHDSIPDPKGKGYVINVAAYQNGVGYGAWNHIDSWSEAVLTYIQRSEHEVID